MPKFVMFDKVSAAISNATSLPTRPDLPPTHELVLKARLSGNDLSVDLIQQRVGEEAFRHASFRFDAQRGDAIVDEFDISSISGDHPNFSGLSRRFMGLSGSGRLDVAMTNQGQQGVRILNAGPTFRITTLNQYYPQPLSAPFFMTDAQRSYFADCTPSTTSVLQTMDKPSSAVVMTPFKASVAAVATSASLVGAKTGDPKPWIRADARVMSRANSIDLKVTSRPANAATASDFKRAVYAEPAFRFVTVPTVAVTFRPFFHPFVGHFIETVRRYGVESLFSLDVQSQALDPAYSFKTRYMPDPNHVTNTDLVEDVDFSPGSPFGPYNTEVFLHMPLMLQALLSQNGHHQEGLKWGARVCDLLGVENDPAEAWKYLPFRQTPNSPTLAELLDVLSSTPGDPKRQMALAQIEASQLYPFQPFRIARLRMDAMKKYAFLQVFNTRLDLADMHFRRYTPEEVDIAHLHYLVLQASLGQQPEVLPMMSSPPKTYAELRPHLDEAGNAVLVVESSLSGLSTLSAPVRPGVSQAATLKLVASRYFCLASNPKLLELWEKVNNRLDNIRNGRTIDGDRRPLGLFGPKIDPAAMVRAVAGGANPGEVDPEQGRDRPNHRFSVLLRVAKERIERLAVLNNHLLQTLEKRDAEELAAKRAKHEVEMAEYIGEARQAQIDEATQTLRSLGGQREAVMLRWRHYREQLGFTDLEEPATDMETGEAEKTGQREASREFKLVDGASVGISISDPSGTIPGSIGIGLSLQSGKILAQEREEALLSFASAAAHGISAHLEAAAGLLQCLPEIEAAAKPMGAGAGVTVGPKQIAGAMSFGAREVGMLAGALAFFSSNAGKQASFVWRERDFALQLKSAAAEVLHIDQLIIGATRTLNSRVKDKVVFTEQSKRNGQVLDYLEGKFSCHDFYSTLSGQLSNLQKQAWAAALARLNEARSAFKFDFSEKDLPALPQGLWDIAPRGLLSAEGLMLAAQALETAYMAKDEQHLGLTRTFSLKQVNPFALVRLRETGQCVFTLSKAWWDLYDPGHFDRRIVEVLVSIPCVCGPDVPVAATLKLLEGVVRDENGDVRQISLPRRCSMIVTSTGREDAGTISRDRSGELYGAFEGGGAEDSVWSIDLPAKYRMFPYRTIPDVKLTLRVRVQQAENLVQPATNGVAEGLNALNLGDGKEGVYHLVSARYEFPDVWHRWLQDPGQNLKHVLAREHLPSPFRDVAKPKSGVALWAKPGQSLTENDFATAVPLTISPQPGEPDRWDVSIDQLPHGFVPEDAYLLLSYELLER